MNIYELISKSESEISNDYLAEKVRESYNRYKLHVEENTPRWQEEGLEMKNMREKLGLSQKHLGEFVGVSPQTIAKMEKGKPVRSRKMLMTSCKTIMDYASSERESDIDLFEGVYVQ